MCRFLFLFAQLFLFFSLAKSLLQSKIQMKDFTIKPLNAKKKKSEADMKRISSNVENYLRMKELMKMKKQGDSYDQIKQASINGTSGSSNSDKASESYRKYIGKGTLDQRLLNIVAYKRANLAAKEIADGTWSKSDEDELKEIMENDDFDDDDDLENINTNLIPGFEEEIEDEEAKFEALVREINEKNKLEEIKRNFMPTDNEKIEDKEKISEISISNDTYNNVNITSKTVKKDAEMYTPKVSTWGVFERPRDISKTYGGGRVITREEMKKMDEEWEERKKESKVVLTAFQQTELKHAEQIKEALSRSRNFMQAGNRESAVWVLGNVTQYTSFQTETGSEVWLEYAMALETIENYDYAKKIYGQIVTLSWSATRRRNALQLLSGLNLMKQLNKNMKPVKPAMDSVNMQIISNALEQGLVSKWDSYKKDKKYTPWIEKMDEIERSIDVNNVQVTNLTIAYDLLIRELNPLRKLPAKVLIKCFRKFYLSKKEELDDLKVKNKEINKMRLDVDPLTGRSISFSPEAIIEQNKKKQEGYKKSYMLNQDYIMATRGVVREYTDEEIETMRLYNGTWEIITSMKDKYPYKDVKYESGSLRRVLDFFRKKSIETFPDLWGLLTRSVIADLSINFKFQEIVMSSPNMKDSIAIWQDKNKPEKCLEVLYCDEILMITREIGKLSDPDIYTLWKRLKKIIYNKY